MRLLVASDQWFPDYRGGSARVATETAVRLARRGNGVVVLAPATSVRAPAGGVDGLAVARVLRRGPLPQTVTDVFETRRHARLWPGSAFDALLAHQPTTAVGLVSALPSTPLVLVFHASPLRESRDRLRRDRSLGGQLASSLLHPTLWALERHAVSAARRIVVLSAFSRSLVLADHPAAADRIVRLPVGVDLDAFSPAADRAGLRAALRQPAGVPLLLTARRLDARMGLEELLRAVALLRRRTEVRLAIVGTGPLDARLRARARELGLERSVAFLGAVSDTVLRDWYRAADLFVLPTAAYEGFGMVTPEALACGTPVVGTPVGAIPEVLAPLDPRLVASGADAAALADAIARALELPAPALRERCRSYACERFSWDEAAASWERALAAVAPVAAGGVAAAAGR